MPYSPPYILTTSTTTTAVTAYDSDVWRRWTTSGAPTGSASTVIWAMWNRTSVDTPTGSVVVVSNHPIAIETPEQRATRREQALQYEGERKQARERAELLLRECLTPAQREELQLHRHFHLETVGKDGSRRRYRIERGRSRNVKQVTAEGAVIKTLCMHPVDWVPDADTMLAQKLYLEADEDAFLRIANHS